MLSRTHLLIVAIAVLGAIAGFVAGGWLRGGPDLAAGQTQKIGETAAAVGLPDLDGRSQAIAQWRGKLVLLNFWASWCGPCREEMPLLDRSQERYSGKGLQIVGVAEDTLAATKSFLSHHPVRYPILLDDPDRGRDVSQDFGNTRGVLPYSVLIGRDGRILAQRSGNFTERSLEQWIAPHL